MIVHPACAPEKLERLDEISSRNQEFAGKVLAKNHFVYWLKWLPISNNSQY